MEIQYSQLSTGIRLIKLIGRMDILGVGAIETGFAGYCAGENPRVLVDLAGVEFMASIGIRLLLVNARSLVSRGRRMVLVGPIDEVKSILEVAGMPSIILIDDGRESAEVVLLANWCRNNMKL